MNEGANRRLLVEAASKFLQEGAAISILRRGSDKALRIADIFYDQSELIWATSQEGSETIVLPLDELGAIIINR